MTTTDPLSLAETKRLAADADTVLLRATRPADLETPIGAFLRLDDGGPSYLLESVEGGERLGRYSFLGVGPRRLLEVRDGLARIQTRPVTVPVYAPDLPIEVAEVPDPLAAIRAFVPRRRVAPGRRDAAVHRWRGRGACLRRGFRVRADRPAAGTRSRGRAHGRLHRDRPRHRLRPPDPHPLGHRVAAHRCARPRGSVPDRRARRSSRPSTGLRGRRRGARGHQCAIGQRRRHGPRRGDGAAVTSRPPIDTSLGREAYIHAVEVAKDAIAAGEAIQVVLARRQSFELPLDPSRARRSTVSTSTGRFGG